MADTVVSEVNATQGRKQTHRVGTVVSDKGEKTIRVCYDFTVKHPKYGKYLRRRTVCHVHDEDNESHAGDTVEIVESRPTSKTKRWRLLRVVSRSSEIDLAAMRAAAKLEEEAGQDETE